MQNELWQALIQIAASTNAVLLGAVLVLSPRLHRTKARRKLGAALIVFGYLLLSFTAKDNLWLPVTGLFILSDYALALVAAALFLDYMASAVEGHAASMLIYLPPLLFLAGAQFAGEQFILGSAISVVVVLQFGYTCATTWVFMQSGLRLSRRPRHLTVLLAGLWVLHGLQFSRMAFPSVGWLFDGVPLFGAAIFLTLTVLVLTDSRALRALGQFEASTRADGDLRAVLERYMQEERPHLDPGLSLDHLAGAVGVPARELSQCIGAGRDGNFYNLVNRHRVAEASSLLVSPRESRTSVEAIGLMSGFRSRSTFYKAFRQQVGMTPAEFRRQQTASD